MQTEWNFDWANIEQNVTLKPGKYKLECWGARGGATGTPYESGFYYGNGGYCSGEIILKKETTLYIYVGIDGRKGYDFNGGGRGGSSSGGGATDIRLIGGEWDNEQGLLSRIIVAGGGGGTYDKQHGGNGGGLKGTLGTSSTGHASHGGTQFEGGRGRAEDGSCDGFFGKGATPKNPSTQSGGGGGWFGGAHPASGFGNGSGGGSGYVLTKDSYKPYGYIPTSEYYFDNVVMTTGGNTTVVSGYSDGRAKITLLQALPFLTVSSYNSTTATFKADHTDPTLLTKIEVFIDDTLKETITADLTTEKTINYTLEDNALHTLKIVVTDSSNTTVEKVLSISNGIAPLPAGSCLEDVTNKWKEIGAAFKNGKTSIVNTLALKNVPASLDNTLVEFSEKIKTFFDNSDATSEELQNQITELNNKLSQRKRYASGIVEKYPTDYPPWNITTNLDFIPSLIYISCSVTYYQYFVCSFACNIHSAWCNPLGDYKPTTRAYISDVTSSNFKVRFINSGGGELTSLDTRPNLNNIRWYAFE
ncbi:glycine rich domain-containing protein [Clostridioides difficile]